MSGDSGDNKVSRRTILRNLGIATGTTILGSGMATAASSRSSDTIQKGRSIEIALAKMSEYMRLDDGYHLTVDERQAKGDHVSKHAQRIAFDFVELNNLIINSLKSGEATIVEDGSKRQQELLNKFEPYFRLIKAGKATRSLTASTAEDSIKQDGLTTMGGGCGGSQSDPHWCPPYIQSGVRRNSKGAIQNYLDSRGYHQTADYATGYEYAGGDYTNPIGAYTCSSPKFRIHALIERGWTFKTQRPEPNPEILGYIWPTFDWGPYVKWWHNNHC